MLIKSYSGEVQFVFQLSYKAERDTIPSLIAGIIVLVEDEHFVITNDDVDYIGLEHSWKDRNNSRQSFCLT